MVNDMSQVIFVNVANQSYPFTAHSADRMVNNDTFDQEIELVT